MNSTNKRVHSTNKLITKAISILTIFLSLFNGIMTIVAPLIYNAISLPGFYLLLSSIIFIGIMILLFIKFNDQKGDCDDVN